MITRILLIVSLAGIMSCGIGKGLGNDIITGAQESLDTLNKQNKGLITTLIDQKAQDRLQHVLDSVLKATSDTLSVDLRTLETRILPPLTGWIDSTIHQALGVRTTAELNRLIDSSVKPKLDLVLKSLNLDGSKAIQAWRAALLNGLPAQIAQLRQSLTGGLGADLVAIRDSLIDSTLGIKLGHAVAAVLDSASLKLHGEEAGMKKIATGVYWAVILGIAGLMILCAYLYRKKHQFMQIADVVTNKISEMPEVARRDDLLDAISRTASDRGVEADLRSFLAKKGKLGDRSREARKSQTIIPNFVIPSVAPTELTNPPLAAGPPMTQGIPSTRVKSPRTKAAKRL